MFSSVLLDDRPRPPGSTFRPVISVHRPSLNVQSVVTGFPPRNWSPSVTSLNFSTSELGPPKCDAVAWFLTSGLLKIVIQKIDSIMYGGTYTSGRRNPAIWDLKLNYLVTFVNHSFVKRSQWSRMRDVGLNHPTFLNISETLTNHIVALSYHARH
jgi:hypothetical protein